MIVPASSSVRVVSLLVESARNRESDIPAIRTLWELRCGEYGVGDFTSLAEQSPRTHDAHRRSIVFDARPPPALELLRIVIQELRSR